jgi:hypothetical protein
MQLRLLDPLYDLYNNRVSMQAFHVHVSQASDNEMEMWKPLEKIKGFQVKIKLVS